MPRLLRIAVIACIAALAFAGTALADKRVALVVGNSAYRAVPSLANPVNDATDVSAKLRALGFTVFTGLDLDVAGFDRTLREFEAALPDADTALFYYAGHGIQADGQNYLLPIDASFGDVAGLKRQSVALGDVLGEMQARAGTVLVFLDACRDNPLSQVLQGTGRSAASNRGLARVDVSARNTLVVFATGPGKIAADGDARNSPFTTAFLAHAGTPGVEIESLMKRVSAGVLQATNGQQEPERLSRLTSEFYFVPPGGTAPAEDKGGSGPVELLQPKPIGLPPPAEAQACKWFGASGQIRSEGYCATSVEAAAGGKTYEAGNLGFAHSNTAWCEGVAGDGIGQMVVYRMDPAQSFSTISLENGYTKSQDIFDKNSRPRLVRLKASDGQEWQAELTDSMETQTISLPKRASVTWVSLTVLSVYPGWKYQDTCLSYFRPDFGG